MTARPIRMHDENDQDENDQDENDQDTIDGHDADRMPESENANNEIKPASSDDVDKARRLADDVEHPDDDTVT